MRRLRRLESSGPNIVVPAAVSVVVPALHLTREAARGASSGLRWIVLGWRWVASTNSAATTRSLMLRRCEIVRRVAKASSGLHRRWAITIPIAWSMTEREDNAIRRCSDRVTSS
jgi:hypothetical protein